MKKRLLLIVLLLLICCACGVGKDIVRTGKGNLIIEYSTVPVFTNSELNEGYYIRLYDDKTISVVNDGKMSDKQDVSDKVYQDIVNYAFSSSFVNLKENLSDDKVMDGSSKYITLFFEDGTSKKYGGINPTNNKFEKLCEMLQEALKDEAK